MGVECGFYSSEKAVVQLTIPRVELTLQDQLFLLVFGSSMVWGKERKVAVNLKVWRALTVWCNLTSVACSFVVKMFRESHWPHSHKGLSL